MIPRTGPFAILALLALTHVPGPASALQFEVEPPPKGEARLPGYLPKGALDFHRFMAPLAAPTSVWEAEDRRMVLLMQRASAARWRRAQLDHRFLYPRFAAAFGRKIDRSTTPALVHLLNRAMSDVYATYMPAKLYFGRKRPYQILRLRRVCGFETPPLDAKRTATPSHPSGHSSLGWSTAMILSLLAPARTAALVARADAYAKNRVVCGVHYPTDIQAGHVVATAVVTRLRADPTFRRDLACARREHATGRPMRCFVKP